MAADKATGPRYYNETVAIQLHDPISCSDGFGANQ
jgi:hypothetical protein